MMLLEDWVSIHLSQLKIVLYSLFDWPAKLRVRYRMAIYKLENHQGDDLMTQKSFQVV
jgi:hypothetical protein